LARATAGGEAPPEGRLPRAAADRSACLPVPIRKRQYSPCSSGPAPQTRGPFLSPVRPATVFYSKGDNLWEHTGAATKAALEILTSGVSAVSAGRDSRGKAAVFADVGDDLREYTGARMKTEADVWSGGVGAFTASQVLADTVFGVLTDGLWVASGRTSKLSWVQVL
jgi:hypothetical protein